MTTFKFNFSGVQDTEQNEGVQFNLQLLKITVLHDLPIFVVELSGYLLNKNDVEWFECEEIIPHKQIELVDDIFVHAKMFLCGDIEIGHVNHIDKIFGNGDYTASALELAEKEHSDLVAGKYEGGLKVWECTNDLMQYLVEHQDTIALNEVKVLDLGCGVGILGIYALLNGSFVTFQDYNKEVISCVTIPSVLLNIEEELREKEIHKCKFYSGDWASFNKILSDLDTYDIILTSETIYNENNYQKLIDLFIKRLSRNGIIYLAAKTCYFGVGGGLRQFETYIEKTGLLNSEVVWKSSGGVQREVLKIKRLLQ